VIIGERLRAFREYKALSQVDMEKRTGLFSSYISRVENGHTIPTLETLTRFARALEVPVFHLVYEEDDPYPPPTLPGNGASIEVYVKLSRKDTRLLKHLNLLFSQLRDGDRQLLFALARRMVKRMTCRPAAAKRLKPEKKAQRVGPHPSGRTPHHANASSRKRSLRPKARSTRK